MIKPRVSKFRDPQKYSILIVCEDGKSAVYYFEAKVKECGLSKSATIEKAKIKDIAVDVEGSKKGSAPISVVKYAIEKRDEYNRQAKTEGKYPYKEVYCVMDVDDHETLGKAVDIINNDNSLSHIISNETFEVWHILHFREYSTKALYRPRKNPKTKRSVPDDQRIDKVLGNFLDKAYEKSDKQIFQLIKKKNGDENKAIQNAKQLEKHHVETSPDKPAYLCNPFTEVYKLIIKLNEISRSRKPVNPAQIGDITQEDLENSDYLFKKDDVFTSHLAKLINTYYPDIAKSEKLKILIELFEKPEYNTACIEKPEIAEFFYPNYYARSLHQ